MNNAAYFIQHLQMVPHPEGGYYKENYRSAESVGPGGLPARFAGSRSFSTAIYYLLQQGDFSGFHRIKSDECWHFYAGETLLIHILFPNGKYECKQLGSDLQAGETFQFVVPALAWFASEPTPHSSFSLVGCTVSPGFDFADFEMADKSELNKIFPEHEAIVNRLCR